MRHEVLAPGNVTSAGQGLGQVELPLKKDGLAYLVVGLVVIALGGILAVAFPENVTHSLWREVAWRAAFGTVAGVVVVMLSMRIRAAVGRAFVSADGIILRSSGKSVRLPWQKIVLVHIALNEAWTGEDTVRVTVHSEGGRIVLNIPLTSASQVNQLFLNQTIGWFVDDMHGLAFGPPGSDSRAGSDSEGRARSLLASSHCRRAATQVIYAFLFLGLIAFAMVFLRLSPVIALVAAAAVLTLLASLAWKSVRLSRMARRILFDPRPPQMSPVAEALLPAPAEPPPVLPVLPDTAVAYARDVQESRKGASFLTSAGKLLGAVLLGMVMIFGGGPLLAYLGETAILIVGLAGLGLFVYGLIGKRNSVALLGGLLMSAAGAALWFRETYH